MKRRNLREAYRAVGIIKKKLGANKDGDGDEQEPTPQQVKKRTNPALYKEDWRKCRRTSIRLVPGIIKDIKKRNGTFHNGHLMKDGKPRFRNQGTTNCLNHLAKFIARS